MKQSSNLHSEWGDKDGDEIQQNITVGCVYQPRIPRTSRAVATYKTQVGPCCMNAIHR
jgi:hypothetical protein